VSLAALLDAIRADTDERIQKIELESQQRCKQISASGLSEAESAYQQEYHAAVQPAESLREKLLQQAKQKALSLVAEVKQVQVENAWQELRKSLAEIRSSLDYPDLLDQFFLEALAEMGPAESNENLCFIADKKDCKILERLFIKHGLQFETEFSISTLGGLNLRSQDGRLVVYNTLESRMKYHEEIIKKEIAAFFQNEEQA
jgi:V/A-type H+-transporting ATPase subunit E